MVFSIIRYSFHLTHRSSIAFRTGYFGAKSKGYNAAIKRAVKEYPLIISDIVRNKRIS
jgi:hypothetical protein